MRSNTLLAGLVFLGMLGIAAAADVNVPLDVSGKEVVRSRAHHLRRTRLEKSSRTDSEEMDPRFLGRGTWRVDGDCGGTNLEKGGGRLRGWAEGGGGGKGGRSLHLSFALLCDALDFVTV